MIKSSLIALLFVVASQSSSLAQLRPSQFTIHSELTLATELGRYVRETFCKRFYGQSKRDEETQLAIAEQIILEMDSLNRNFLYKTLADPTLEFYFEIGGRSVSLAYCQEPIKPTQTRP